MTLPARRAALTAVVSIGCKIAIAEHSTCICAPSLLPAPALTSPLDRVRVVLCATSHPGNIGAAARAMRAMGLSRLVLVAPQQFPNPDADARAAGAIALLRAGTGGPALDAALAGAALAIGFSARPRGFAGAASPVPAPARGEP